MKSRKRFLIVAALVAAVGAALVIIGTAADGGGSSGIDSRRAKQEEELAAFLETGEGVGKVSVRLCLSEDGTKIVGAAVVCEGGRDPYVRTEIIRLLSAALGVGANRIYVYGTS